MIINNKEAKFFWGAIAFEVYQEAVMKSKRKFNALSVTSVTAILWGGILNHYERLFEECPFEYSEVYDFVQASAKKGKENIEIDECIKAFNDSAQVQDFVYADDGEKKNSVLESSEQQPTKQGSPQETT